MGLALAIKVSQSVHPPMIAGMACPPLHSPELPPTPRGAVCKCLSQAAAAAAVVLAMLHPGRAALAQDTLVTGLPALGEASTDDLSGSAERRLGQSIYQTLLRAGVVYDDPEAQDYLQVQAGRLLAAAQARGELGPEAGLAPHDFRFFLVKDPSINAFALPGGYIGVHSGLVVQAARESELMSVLAHEIGHVTQRHIARMFGQQRQSSGVMIAAALLAAMAAGSNPDAAMGIVSLGQTVALKDQLSFSRDAEREADRVGLMLLRDAGFDAQAMARLFQKLAQAGRYYETGAPSWLRSHPLTSERIADVQTRIQSLGRGESMQRAGQVADQMARPEPSSEESLEFAWIRQRLEATAVRSVDGLARMAVLLAARRSDPGSASAHDQARIAYGQAWVALLQRDLPAVEGFLATSRLAAGQAKESTGLRTGAAAGSPRLATVVAPFWAVIQSQAHLIAGQPAAALERVEQALALWPRSVSTRPLVRTAIEAELLLQRPLAALSRARWLTSQWPEDLEAWRLQSQAAAASARLTEAHAAQAERYWLQGALSAALEQFAFARKAGDSDFVSLSQIDAKMTTLRTQILRLKEETR